MPEPKNYATWREKLAILVAAATEGTYTEIWNLPTGATFRISGRPHPDGALAFLFEDITAEVSMSRRFTAELELHRELLNNLDGAIAIFSISGELYHQNEAHAHLWVAYQPTQKADQQSKMPASCGNCALNRPVCGERYAILSIKSTNAKVGERT